MRHAVELTIGSLVLDGCRPGDRYVCGDAFTIEMDRLLREQGLPDRITGKLEPLQLPAGAFETPAKLGRELARAIFFALCGEQEDTR